MKISLSRTVVGTIIVILCAPANWASAAEIKVLSSLALKAVMAELVPQFEKTAGHKVAIQFDGDVAVKRRIDAGETFDVTILRSDLMDELIKQNRLTADTRADIARSGMGVAVRASAPKPDISSADAFKKSLIAATSIGYTDPARGGASGVYTAGLLSRLGLTADLKSKTKLTTSPAALAGAVAKGEIEIGMTQISEILPQPGIDLVGPFPTDLQTFTVFAAGVLTNSKEQEAGKVLFKFLTSPAALPIIKAKGMEPG